MLALALQGAELRYQRFDLDLETRVVGRSHASSQSNLRCGRMGREPIEVETTAQPVETLDVDVLAVGVTDPPELSGPAAELDAALGGRLRALADDGELKGTAGSLVVVHASAQAGPRRVAAAGLGKRGSVDRDAVRAAAARVARRARGIGRGVVGWAVGENVPLAPADQVAALVEGTVLGDYDPGVWKTGESRPEPLRRLVVWSAGARGLADVAERAAVVSAWTNRCRELVDSPANDLTPQRLAERAAELLDDLVHVRVAVLGRREIENAGMGAFAAVARGSHAEPRLVVLEYQPPRARAGVDLGLVGKAITFDSGGLSLKPAARMAEMKGDMAGGAAVICGVGAIAELGIPLHVVAVVPACENMPSGHAARPGDVVTALNGKTIEITNTDAEGRLLLADALVEARRRGASHVLDLATLTGGVVVALGDYFAGLMGNEESWLAEVEAAAEPSGDHVWRLPVHDTLLRYFRSDVADMKNSSGTRQGSPIYAARFLQEFAGEGPWAHVDIAGTAHLERGRGDYFSRAGATGFGVRLLAALAERLV